VWELFEASLMEGCAGLGLAPSAGQVRLMRLHAEAMLEQNERAGLTVITEPREMAIKHFVDSLTCLPYVAKGGRIADIGTGAGFPGIPLKIMEPEISLTLVESSIKKAEFLKSLPAVLGLRFDVVAARAEEFGRSRERQSFDIVIARAVAKMNVLAEYCLPLVKVGGLAIAMKGPASDEEMKTSQVAIATLGGAVEEVKEFGLPLDGGRRRLVLIRKTSETPPRYPRRPGSPAKKPL